MPYFKFVRASGNKKTGPIPVTTTSQDTCPDVCVFKRGADGKNNGCYADGYPLRMHWDRLTRGEGRTVLDFSGLLRMVRSIAPGRLWRHNQAGDLPHNHGRIDTDALENLTRANADARAKGFTYTHHDVRSPMGVAHNVPAIRAANDGGFTVNVSANSARGVDLPMRMGLPTVCVLPADAGRVTHSPEGRRIVTCPATYRDSGPLSDCERCGLCQKRNRDYAIGFPVHGSAKRVAERASAAADS